MTRREQFEDIKNETAGQKGKGPIALGDRPRGRRGAGKPGAVPPPEPESESDDGQTWEEFSEEKKARIKLGLRLQCKMWAKFPTAFLPPPLDPEEEEVMTAALYDLGEAYLPYWFQEAGPWAMLGSAIASIYLPRLLLKLDQMKEAKARAAANANSQKATPGRSVGTGENVSGNGASRE